LTEPKSIIDNRRPEREEAMVATEAKALATFYGDDAFPVEWEPGERELLWVRDDLHCPNPLSPLFFDLGGWWLTCDHMFRRFATPFACDWVAKSVNGYLYTAAIPADPSVRAEANEYEARYVPRVPADAEYASKMGAYLGAVLPQYAANFLDWWRDRLRPEIERNFAYLDGYDMDSASLVELAVLLEDAIDVHDRHWKIHWMLNFAQFSATMALNGTLEQVRGTADPALLGRLQSSLEDRNWDSIEALWRMKEEIRQDQELLSAFAGETADDVLRALDATERGSRFRRERIEAYQREFGYKSIWSHELSFPTWRENPAPIVEAVRGYLESDYDYPAAIAAVRADLEAATAEAVEGLEGEAGEQLRQALDLSLKMNPLTPDHHFYIDQGTNARLRLVAIAIGRKLVQAEALDDAEDVVYLRYNELRLLTADPEAFDARSLVSERRDTRERQAEIRPPDWIGTATEEALAFPYLTLWGFPEKFYRQAPERVDEVHGLGASPGVVEGPARKVSSLDEFDKVREGEVLVCEMTNPAWVVLFTKIAGLVTDAGGVASHPAVVAREFSIPAVVGTSIATERIETGDRVRVNGTSGTVEVLR
jgi:phosphohistidine swiveling domain-containing protein